MTAITQPSPRSIRTVRRSSLFWGRLVIAWFCALVPVLQGLDLVGLLSRPALLVCLAPGAIGGLGFMRALITERRRTPRARRARRGPSAWSQLTEQTRDTWCQASQTVDATIRHRTSWPFLILSGPALVGAVLTGSETTFSLLGAFFALTLLVEMLRLIARQLAPHVNVGILVGMILWLAMVTAGVLWMAQDVGIRLAHPTRLFDALIQIDAALLLAVALLAYAPRSWTNGDPKVERTWLWGFSAMMLIGTAATLIGLTLDDNQHQAAVILAALAVAPIIPGVCCLVASTHAKMKPPPPEPVASQLPGESARA